MSLFNSLEVYLLQTCRWLGIVIGCVYCFVSPTLAGELDDSLRVGFYSKSFPDFSVEDIEITVKLLAEELGKEVGIKTQVTVYEDIQQMRRDFDANQVNFVVASSIMLVTEFEQNSLNEGFRLIRLNDSADRVLILGRIKSGKHGLNDYRGARLQLAQTDEMTDLYMDYLAWSTFKGGYKQNFKLLAREKKAHQMILKLYFDAADLTCVYGNAYETALEMNPQLKEQIQVVAQADNIPQGMGFFNQQTPSSFRELVIKEAINMSTRPRGQQLLQLFKSERAIRSFPSDLIATRQLNAAYQQLIKSK